MKLEMKMGETEDKEEFAQQIRSESVALCNHLDNISIHYGVNMYKEILQHIKERQAGK